MRIELALGENPVTDISSVQEMVANKVLEITTNIGNALLTAYMWTPHLKPQELANQIISKRHVDLLSTTDQKTRMVYQKLFDATKEHIETHSTNVLGLLFKNIDSSDDFLATFVEPEVTPLIQELEDSQPWALETPSTWKPAGD